MRKLVGLCAVGLASWALAQTSASPQAANSAPARATVYIRLMGDVEFDPPVMLPTGQALRLSDIELGSGSGFLFSPYGHVLTCSHVIQPESATVLYQGIRTRARPTVRRVEVLLPPDDSGSGAPSTPYQATVVAKDDDLDLAALSISTGNTPYLHLGDSDAPDGGEVVEAIGYPFGRRLEIAQPAMSDDAVPAASISRGNISASRLDAQGERRYLQTTAALNAGNSGGPVVDADGYVVGIANSVFGSRNAPTGVGFAVPINLAKRFLEAHSLDGALAGRSIALGPLATLEGKGLRAALPQTLADRSAIRSRVDTAGDLADAIVLRVDRVLSPWPAIRLAEALTTGQAFEAFSPSSAAVQRAVEVNQRRLLMGHVTGTQRGGAAARMEYAIIERGPEKIVARYIGPPPQVAFVASTLRASLKTLEADSLRPSGRDTAPAPSWSAWPTPRGTPLDRVAVPSEWILEPVGPYRCPGLPLPSDAVSWSRAGDFALALRAAWMRGAGGASEAATACGGDGREAPGTYRREIEALGVRYLIVGTFVPLSSGDLIQLEGSAPLEQAAALRAVFSRWIEQASLRGPAS